METIITRDTDIIREYIAVLDARERGMSLVARLAATVKFARLRRELAVVHLDVTDEDFAALRREIDERLSRSVVRRFEARNWGARFAVLLILVVGQQLALALVLALAALLGRFAPIPGWWNRALPHDEPALLYTFIFVFFFATPLLALAVVYGGRYFRAWRRTLPATLALIALSGIGTFLSVRGRPNPVLRSPSLAQFARDRGVNLHGYHDWVDANWLLKDPKFQRDYERFLRNGPGRWIASRDQAKEDAAWKDSLGWMNEYVDQGQDPNSFRDWLKYYLDRNRIYSEDRIDQEANTLTAEANQRFLRIWQVEPFLKERDERMYRAYLGSVNAGMKKWGLAALGLYFIAFAAAYLVGGARSFWQPASFVSRLRGDAGKAAADSGSGSSPLSNTSYSFPERSEITSPPFFDTPFKLLARVHRSFMGLAVSTIIVVFAFWAVVYASDLASGHENAPSQVALMRSYMLFGGRPDSDAESQAAAAAEPGEMQAAAGAASGASSVQQNFSYSGAGAGPFGQDLAAGSAAPSRESILMARIAELEQRLDDFDYDTSKKIKSQGRLITSQTSQIDFLKSLTSQLQQTTSQLPQQVSDLTSRASIVEERTGQALGDISAAKQQVDTVDKKLTTRLGELETKATRASEMAGKVEDQASSLATRTEALEKELDRRARQIEARTEELGERTVVLKEREERMDRLQRAALGAILSEIKAETEDLDGRTRSAFYRFFNKGEARRESESLAARISQLTTDLGQFKTDEAKKLIEQLQDLARRVDQIASRVK